MTRVTLRRAAGEIAFAALLFAAFVLPVLAAGCYSVHSRTRTTEEKLADGSKRTTTETNRGAGAVSAKGLDEAMGEVGEKAAGFLGFALDSLKAAGVGGGAVGLLGTVVNRFTKRSTARAIHEQYRERDAHWDQAAATTALALAAGPRPSPVPAHPAGPAPAAAGAGAPTP